MKIVTNLIPARLDSARMAAAGLSVGALLLLAVTAWMVVATIELRAHEVDLRARVTALKSNDHGDAVARDTAVRDLSAVRDRVQRLNQLIGHSGRPTPSLLEILERLLPAPCRPATSS